MSNEPGVMSSIGTMAGTVGEKVQEVGSAVATQAGKVADAA